MLVSWKGSNTETLSLEIDLQRKHYQESGKLRSNEYSREEVVHTATAPVTAVPGHSWLSGRMQGTGRFVLLRDENLLQSRSAFSCVLAQVASGIYSSSQLKPVSTRTGGRLNWTR